MELLRSLTVQQAAEILNCSVQTVGRLCATKRLSARDIGTGKHRHWRINHASVLSYDASTPPASASAPGRRKRSVVVPRLVGSGSPSSTLRTP
jgi:excisionase family DNA binding protein